MNKSTVYDEFFADDYCTPVIFEAVKRGYVRINDALLVELVTTWADIDKLREELHA